jgi:hypothetical protein
VSARPCKPCTTTKSDVLLVVKVHRQEPSAYEQMLREPTGEKTMTETTTMS